jgi:hypothetical protein
MLAFHAVDGSKHCAAGEDFNPGTFAVFPVLADCTFLESQPVFWCYLITMVLSFS